MVLAPQQPVTSDQTQGPGSPAWIIEQVKLKETATAGLRARMDGDLDLWNLKPFQGLDENDEEYRHYTTNAPKTLALKVISEVAGADRIIRIETTNQTEQVRRLNDSKERFGIGTLKKADTHQEAIGRPPVQDQLAWVVCVRGPIITRDLLRIGPNGETISDVTVWDPRNAFWEYGSEGLIWACHVIRKSRFQILTEYGRDMGSDGGTNQGWRIYDFYTDQINTVFTEEQVILKPPTPHGSPRIPVLVTIPGSALPIQSSSLDDADTSFGESIFEADRITYPQVNDSLSIYAELMARSREPGWNVFSNSGEFTLDEDPNLSGQNISLATGQDQDLKPRETPETTRDAAVFLNYVTGDMQRGGLPNTSFGELDLNISGFAINSLQAHALTVLQPRLRAVQKHLLGIINLFKDQFTTGFFPPMSVTGTATSGFFDEVVDPQSVALGGEFTLNLVANLPQDDVGKLNIAQLWRTPGPDGNPLGDDRFIREEVLNIQDVDNMADAIQLQMAKRGSPLASMLENYQSAINAGENLQAQAYFLDILMFFQQFAAATGQLPPIEPPSGPESGSPSNTQIKGTLPQVSPPQAAGINASPTQQQGPVVPAGTPRPGAQNDTTRLGNLGLVGPRG